MGGPLALHFAYRFCTDLAGVFALSSFLNDKSLVYEVSGLLSFVLVGFFCHEHHLTIVIFFNTGISYKQTWLCSDIKLDLMNGRVCR